MTSERVYVEVSGLTGTGKSAVMGEIEIALRALGLTVEHDAGFQSEKNMTHADWQTALDLYNPVAVLRERNIPRTKASATPPVQGEAVVILRRLFDEKRPAYHDCIDAGEMQCAWCDAEDFLAALTPPAGGEG